MRFLCSVYSFTPTQADPKLNISKQFALVAREAISLLGCLRQSIASKPRDVVLPLCSALVRHIWYAATSIELLIQERYGCNGGSPAKGYED